MNRRLLHLFLAAGIVLVFFGCSNKNSSQACIHEVTMNLDKGNYNAVLESSCANAMQKGAAYFGLAGFDITQVINNLSKTGVASSSTNTQNDLTVYMTALVSHASGTSLAYIDDALNSYGSVTTAGSEFTLDNYKDAQFYISMVDVVKSLSLISIVMPNLLDANGNLNTSCDANGNGVPDDADASACALIASAIISEGASTLSCSGAAYAQTGDLVLSDSTGSVLPGIYSGLTITMTGGGDVSGCIVSPPNPSNISYKRLLYKTQAGQYFAATTTTDICTDNTSQQNQWPCPIIQSNGQPLDLVSAIDQTLASSVSTLSSSLTTSLTGTTDVQQAVTDIQAQACCGCTSTPCQACTTSCTSQDLANYIQTNLK